MLRGPGDWATVHDRARLVDGRLQLAGRAGDIVATGGHKVSLPEVEHAFDTMPGLGAVCAVALPDPRLGTVVALVIEGSFGRSSPAREEGSSAGILPNVSSPPDGLASVVPLKAELQAWARHRLAPQSVPRRWYMLERIPRTAGGKIRRPATISLIEQGEGIRL